MNVEWTALELVAVEWLSPLRVWPRFNNRLSLVGPGSWRDCLKILVGPGSWRDCLKIPPSVVSRLWSPRLAIPISSKGMLADLVSHLRTAVVPCWTFIDGSEHFLEYAIHVSRGRSNRCIDPWAPSLLPIVIDIGDCTLYLGGDSLQRAWMTASAADTATLVHQRVLRNSSSASTPTYEQVVGVNGVSST